MRPYGQRGSVPLPPLKRGADGRYQCRWCDGPVPKGRRFWCGEACVLEYRMRADWNFIRDEIIKRDKVCADCRGARYSCVGGKKRAPIGWEMRLSYMVRTHFRNVPRDLIWGKFNAIEQRWEVDHIMPVVEGGTDDPANLRLLCVPCHHQRTARWRRERAAGPADRVAMTTQANALTLWL